MNKTVTWNIPLIIQLCLVSALIKNPNIAVALSFITTGALMAFKEHSDQKIIKVSVNTEERLKFLTEALEAQSTKLSEVASVAMEAKAASTQLSLANGIKRL